MRRTAWRMIGGSSESCATSACRGQPSEEMKTCIPYLHEQIDLIRPRVLVALGGTAMEGLLNKTGITKLRGHWHAWRGIKLMPTYHPAYVLRQYTVETRRAVWDDLQKVMAEAYAPTVGAYQRADAAAQLSLKATAP